MHYEIISLEMVFDNLSIAPKIFPAIEGNEKFLFRSTSLYKKLTLNLFSRDEATL